MKESELKEFFDGDLDVLHLTRAIEESDADADLTADLDGEVVLTCEDLVRLCDAHLHGALGLEGLRAIAAGVLCSDNFTWDEGSEDGELVAEVLWDWSSSEPSSQVKLSEQSTPAAIARSPSSPSAP